MRLSQFRFIIQICNQAIRYSRARGTVFASLTFITYITCITSITRQTLAACRYLETFGVSPQVDMILSARRFASIPE